MRSPVQVLARDRSVSIPSSFAGASGKIERSTRVVISGRAAAQCGRQSCYSLPGTRRSVIESPPRQGNGGSVCERRFPAIAVRTPSELVGAVGVLDFGKERLFALVTVIFRHLLTSHCFGFASTNTPSPHSSNRRGWCRVRTPALPIAAKSAYGWESRVTAGSGGGAGSEITGAEVIDRGSGDDRRSQRGVGTLRSAVLRRVVAGTFGYLFLIG